MALNGLFCADVPLSYYALTPLLQKWYAADAVSCSVSVTETEEFLGDVDEDLEAMQGTVYLLQQELKDAKERLEQQQAELDSLRAKSTGSNGAGLLTTSGDGVESSDLLTKLVGIVDPTELLQRTAGGRTLAADTGKGVRGGDAAADLPIFAGDGIRVKVESMDVDGGERVLFNAVRTSPPLLNDCSAAPSEQQSELHCSTVDRFRTASAKAELVGGTSDCVENGTDSEKLIAAAAATASN